MDSILELDRAETKLIKDVIASNKELFQQSAP
jgi:hypothetical protein